MYMKKVNYQMSISDKDFKATTMTMTTALETNEEKIKNTRKEREDIMN